MAFGFLGSHNGAKATVSTTAGVEASPSPTVSVSIEPSETPVFSSTPTPTPDRQATANTMVHLRVGPSVNTDIMTDVPAGATVKLGGYSDSQWQQVTYNGLNGYVFKSYLNY